MARLILLGGYGLILSAALLTPSPGAPPGIWRLTCTLIACSTVTIDIARDTSTHHITCSTPNGRCSIYNHHRHHQRHHPQLQHVAPAVPSPKAALETPTTA